MQRQGTDHERDPYLFPESGESPENIPETLRQGSGTSARQTGFGNTKKQPRDAVDWMVCMSKYVLKRLAMLIPVLIGVTFMVYFILSLSPGDTAAMIAGESADAETIEATRKDLGLDQPDGGESLKGIEACQRDPDRNLREKQEFRFRDPGQPADHHGYLYPPGKGKWRGIRAQSCGKAGYLRGEK